MSNFREKLDKMIEDAEREDDNIRNTESTDIYDVGYAGGIVSALLTVREVFNRESVAPNLGDRVVIREYPMATYVGTVGEIVSVEPYDESFGLGQDWTNRYGVRLDDGGFLFVAEQHITKA